MNVALNVYHVFDSFSRVGGGKVGEWLERNPDAARIYQNVMELRVQNGYYSAAIKDRD
jgi:hypothetical protein